MMLLSGDLHIVPEALATWHPFHTAYSSQRKKYAGQSSLFGTKTFH